MKLRHLCCQSAETVADGVDAPVGVVAAQGESGQRYHHDGRKRARQAFRHLRSEDNHSQRHQCHHECGDVDLPQRAEVDSPFGEELRGEVLQTKPQEVVDLGGEDCKGDTGGESHHDRVGDEFYHRAQAEEPHQHQYQTGHECGYCQPFKTEVGDDAVDNHDERPGRAADLHGVAAESRHHEAAHYGGDQADRRTHARSDGECNGQRERHDSHHNAGHKVGLQLFGAVMAQSRPQTWPELNFST